MKQKQPMIWPKEEITMWCDALESGKYRQGHGKLQTADGFCCLGVALDLFCKDYPKKDGKLTGTFPIYNFGAPRWLHDIDDSVAEKNGVRLSAMNDADGKTFPEIAAVLRKLYLEDVP